MTDWLEELLEENEESLRWGWSVPGGGVAEEESQAALPWTEAGRQAAMAGTGPGTAARDETERAVEEAAAGEGTAWDRTDPGMRALPGWEGGSLGLYRRLRSVGPSPHPHRSGGAPERGQSQPDGGRPGPGGAPGQPPL